MGKMDKVFIFIIGLAISWLISSAQGQSRPAPNATLPVKKIVFIAGPDSHGKGEHEHNGGCTLLAKALNDSLHGVEAIVVRNGWPQDESVLDDAAAIVFYLAVRIIWKSFMLTKWSNSWRVALVSSTCISRWK